MWAGIVHILQEANYALDLIVAVMQIKKHIQNLGRVGREDGHTIYLLETASDLNGRNLLFVYSVESFSLEDILSEIIMGHFALYVLKGMSS